MPRLVIRGEDLDWREVDGETIVLDRRTSQYLSLNGSGSVLWRRLAAGATHDELVDVLLESFAELDRGKAESDVQAFLATLEQQDLLVER